MSWPSKERSGSRGCGSVPDDLSAAPRKGLARAPRGKGPAGWRGRHPRRDGGEANRAKGSAKSRGKEWEGESGKNRGDACDPPSTCEGQRRQRRARPRRGRHSRRPKRRAPHRERRRSSCKRVRRIVSNLEASDRIMRDWDSPEEGEELALHLVDLAEGEEVLSDQRPRLVRVGVVHRDLAREHQGREEEAVGGGRRAASRGVAGLETGEKEERLVGNGDGKTSAVQRVGL